MVIHARNSKPLKVRWVGQGYEVVPHRALQDPLSCSPFLPSFPLLSVSCSAKCVSRYSSSSWDKVTLGSTLMPAVPLNGPDGSAASNTSCFNYDGSLSPDVFCDLEGKDTCCGAGWDCLTNGLCRQSGTTSYAQGTCLNKAFDRCLSFCNQRTPLPSRCCWLMRFNTENQSLSAIRGVHRSEQLRATGR